MAILRSIPQNLFVHFMAKPSSSSSNANNQKQPTEMTAVPKSSVGQQSLYESNNPQQDSDELSPGNSSPVDLSPSSSPRIQRAALTKSANALPQTTNPPLANSSPMVRGHSLQQTTADYDSPDMTRLTASVSGIQTGPLSAPGSTPSRSSLRLLRQQQVRQSLKSSGSTSSSLQQHRQSSEIQLGREDRIVSTSYSSSLDMIFQKVSLEKEQRRLSILKEEQSRPGTAVVAVNQAPRIAEEEGVDGGTTVDHSVVTEGATTVFLSNATGTVSDGGDYYGDMFHDMSFVQFGSQDIQYEVKKKEPKVVGRYLLGDVLGEGSYGKVKEGFCIETLERVAVKIMKQTKLKKISGGEANVKREIGLLKQLRHKNIIKLMDVIYKTDKMKIYVVFEYCAGTLSSLMERTPQGKLPLSQCQRYFKQLVRGLRYLHARSVIHHDIKPGNLLITFDEVLKISDFGVAEDLTMYSKTDTLTTSSGSPAFQPPEIAGGAEKFSGSKVDIWAAGVTLYQLISGRLPFDGETIYALFDSIAKCEFSMPAEADDIVRDLLKGILERDPEKRLDLNAIAVHTWLKGHLPRSPDELPIIPGSSAWSLSDEPRPLNQISNPKFSNDTTLIPYLEVMFDDLRTLCKRSSLVEAEEQLLSSSGSRTRRFSARLTLPDNLFKRKSRPNSATVDLDKQAGGSEVSSGSQPSLSSPRSPTREQSDRCKIQ